MSVSKMGGYGIGKFGADALNDREVSGLRVTGRAFFFGVYGDPCDLGDLMSKSLDALGKARHMNGTRSHIRASKAGAKVEMYIGDRKIHKSLQDG